MAASLPAAADTTTRPVSQTSGSPAAAADTTTELARSPLPSSTHAHPHAHTPFLQNLSQRFRRGSNVSSNTSDSQGQQHTLGQGQGAQNGAAGGDKSADHNGGGEGGWNTAGKAAMTPKQQERARAEAARAAKRYLMGVVRGDWEFREGVSGSGKDGQGAWRNPEGKEPTGWRLRDEGSGDEDGQRHGQRQAVASPTHGKKRSKGSAGQGDPYKFENPDAVADYVRERQVKRRKVLREQMDWNEGLRHWVAERDAWTGAVWRRDEEAVPLERKTSRKGSEIESNGNGFGIMLNKGDIPDSETTTTQTTASPAPSEPGDELNSRSASADTDSLEHTATLTNAANPPAYTIPTDPDVTGPYVPIYPPLFPPDNLLRSRINPSAYGTIYSKVVVQSLTPNIPVPLPDMIRSLVAGWKSEGMWPPGSTAGADIAAAGAGKTKGRDGGAFGRWRKDKEKERQRRGMGSVSGLVEGEGGTAGAEGKGHRVRRSISSVVKKVIGMDEEGRRESEVGLSLGFEEDDDEAGEALGGEGDEKLNKGLLKGEGKS
jgi:hypothetical protein